MSTTALTPDIDILKNVVSEDRVAVSSMTNLLDVSDLDGIDALTPGTRSSYCSQNFVPIPPFLLKVIHQVISDSNGDSKMVLLQVIEAIKAFDSDYADDKNYVDKAKSKCADLVK